MLVRFIKCKNFLISDNLQLFTNLHVSTVFHYLFIQVDESPTSHLSDGTANIKEECQIEKTSHTRKKRKITSSTRRRKVKTRKSRTEMDSGK